VSPARLPQLATVAFAASGSARFTPRTRHGIAALLSWVMKVVSDSWPELKRHSVACHGYRQEQRKFYAPAVSMFTSSTLAFTAR
jgi:hypothetical protein